MPDIISPLEAIARGSRGNRAREYLRRVLPDKYSSMEMTPFRGGSGRVALKLGDNLVVKAANMPRGLRENAWSAEPLLEQEGLIPKLEAKSDDNDWIIQEFLRDRDARMKIKPPYTPDMFNPSLMPATREKVLDSSTKLTKDLLTRFAHANGFGPYRVNRIEAWESPQMREGLEQHGLDFLSNYPTPDYVGDFFRPAHWRFRGKQPVMIDASAYGSGLKGDMPWDEVAPVLERRRDAGLITPGHVDLLRHIAESRAQLPNGGLQEKARLGFAGGGYMSVAKALLDRTWRVPKIQQDLARDVRNKAADDTASSLRHLITLPKSMKEDFEGRLRDELGRSTLSMRVGPVELQKILEEGRIKNQHETGTSNGYLGPMRKEFEQRFFGYSPEARNDEYPKYGYAHLPGTVNAGNASSYGIIKMMLDPALKDRSTVHFGDSLGSRVIPSRWDDPKALSFEYLNGAGLSPSPREAIRDMTTGNRLALDAVPLYPEAQIHGPLDTSAIKGVTFPKPSMRTNQFGSHESYLKSVLDDMNIPWEHTDTYDYAGGGLVKKGGELIDDILHAKMAPMTTPRGGEFLMPRDVGMYTPGVEQVDLPRVQGVGGRLTERMQDLLDSRAAKRKVDALINKGNDLGMREWYGTEPMHQMFLNEGNSEEDWRRMIAHLASASQRNPVDKQNHMGSFLWSLDKAGALTPDTTLVTNNARRKGLLGSGPTVEFPPGYGSLAQSAIFDRAKTIANEGIDAALPPDAKLGTFYRNLLGNLRPVTVDVNAVRGPVLSHKDPRWLATLVKEKDEEGNVIKTMRPRAEFESGELSLKDALDRPGLWLAAPKGSEYRGFEKLWQSAAKRHGVAPAEAQALGWYGSGDITALKTKPELYIENIERLARRTGEQEGRNPLEVLKRMYKGEGYLRASGGFIDEGETGSRLRRLKNRYAGGGVVRNWLAGVKGSGIERVLQGLKNRFGVGEFQEPTALEILDPADRAARIARNQWIDKNLRNYILREMGTEKDPLKGKIEGFDPADVIRKIKASELTNGRHPIAITDALSRGEHPWLSRLIEQDKPRGWSQEQYEKIMQDMAAGKLGVSRDVDGRARVPDSVRALEDKYQRRFAPPVELHDIHADAWVQNMTPHINSTMDWMREALRTGELRPEALNRVSVPQAFESAKRYHEALAKKQTDAMLSGQGMKVHKEYPGGFRWMKYDPEFPNVRPEDSADGKKLSITRGSYHGDRYKIFEDALKAEGDAMGHCVGSYCDDVLSGSSEIYSLRDAKGRPHVTVEVNPRNLENVGLSEVPNDIVQAFSAKNRENKGRGVRQANLGEYLLANHPDVAEKLSLAHITQIKGKANRAPNEEYLPFVQDFVRSGKWGEVGDLKNTGLMAVRSRGSSTGQGVMHYMTKEEAEPFKRYPHIDRNGVDSGVTKWLSADEYRALNPLNLREDDPFRNSLPGRSMYDVPDDWVPGQPKPEGFARGGQVRAPDPAIDAALTESEQRNGLPPGILHSVAEVESNKNPAAVNEKSGATGLMQFMPKTAKWLGLDPKDPIASAMKAGEYMKYLLDRFGSIDRALAAYNWGEGNLERSLAKAPHERKMPEETSKYVGRILGTLIGRPEAKQPAAVQTTAGIGPKGPKLPVSASLEEDPNYQEALGMLERMVSGDPGAEDFLSNVMFDPHEEETV